MEDNGSSALPLPKLRVEVETGIFSKDAVLRTCYWLSRDFDYEIAMPSEARIEVQLSPKRPLPPEVVARVKSDFFTTATDFELRSRVEAQTSSIRELILAKAFAESGVLEDNPEGIFSDPVEGSDPEGMFNKLKTNQF